VLASIRALVSAETHARVEGRPSSDVILLTPEMRLDVGAGEDLAEGIEEAPAPAAPILDESRSARRSTRSCGRSFRASWASGSGATSAS
jgi:hypothetical protein